MANTTLLGGDDTGPARFVGPVAYVAFVLPREANASATLAGLLEQVDSGSIELLDLEILAPNSDGQAERQPLGLLRHDDSFDLSSFEGAESGLLDEDDLLSLGTELGVDEIALVVVYADRSLATVAARVGEAGGRQLWAGGVDPATLDPSLTTIEGV